MEKQNYLVDVPVQFNIWIRPQCQKQQWAVIHEAKPSQLFIVSDGGRNEKEWNAIRENRAMVENGIDWDCKVTKIYFDSNQGMYQTAIQAYKIIWSMVDRCIFMEDDIVPAVSWFRFCAELLERYKNDTRVNMICGMNHLGNYERPSSDYFFSTQGSIWGYATWKRVYDHYYDFSYGKDPYVLDLLNHETKNHQVFQKKIDAYAKDEYYQGHVAFEEFFQEFGIYGYHQLNIVPTRNMISNVGATEDSAHFADLKKLPKQIRNLFGMKRYELEGEIRHPSYVIPDYYYDAKVHEIMADEGTWNRTKRFIEAKYLYLANGGNLAEGIHRVIHRKLAGSKELEK